MQVRKVGDRGEIYWRAHRHVFVSETLIGERIGLDPVDDRWYILYFAQFPLARFDSSSGTVHRLRTHNFYTEWMQGRGTPPSPAPHPQNPDQNLSTMCPV